MNGQIMVFLDIQTNIGMIKPVLKAMELKHYPYFVATYDMLRDRMRNDLKKEGIPFLDIESFWTPGIKTRAKKIKKQVSETWKLMKEDRHFQGSLKYNGIPVWDLVREDFEFYFGTRKRMFEVVDYALEMEALLEEKRPKLIIALDELSETGLPLALLAKRANIPLVIIQHGAFDNNTLTQPPSFATKKCVWSPAVKKILLERGFKKSQLVVTGCPKFDEIYERKRVLHAKTENC